MARIANAFNGASPAASPRFPRQLGLLLGVLVLTWLSLALLSYDRSDKAWSMSGASTEVHNWLGAPGAYAADLAFFTLGLSAYWLLVMGLYVWLGRLSAYFRSHDEDVLQGVLVKPQPGWHFALGALVLLASSTALEWARLYRFESHMPGSAGGVLGYLLGAPSQTLLGFNGMALAWIAAGVVGASLAFGFSWGSVAESIGAAMTRLATRQKSRHELQEDLAIGRKAMQEREQNVSQERREPSPLAPLVPRRQAQSRPAFDSDSDSDTDADADADADAAPFRHAVEPILIVEPVPPSDRVVKERQKPLFNELPDSTLPQISLLDPPLMRQETVGADTLEMTSRLIEKKLKDFGVEVRVVAAAPGPVITRYEIEPATGVKGSQIVALSKDLARSLSLVSIRVVETIPGKNYMALELPNARRQAIRLSEILGSSAYDDAKSDLTLSLGKDIIGNPIVADLAKMPHVLVAGTTGSGKSVGINAMILSMLFKAEAKDVRLLMIDPKMLEMSVYEGIPHLLAPVVTDMRQAAHGLNWCVAEMERRYKLLSKMGVRNLAGYNAKIDAAKEAGTFVYNPFSLTPDEPEPLQRLPHIVVVIDELADLMMVVGKKIEELIARLAQKARAAGIHLILATQRPSVDVITGLIKANIPTRIAFQVSSKIDSRTILDQMGAEALLGMGDMLYMPSGTGLPIRVHGAFVSDDEVHRVVEYLKSQGEPDYIEGVLEGGTTDEEGSSGAEGQGGGEQDPLYDQAVEVVLKHRKASISLVQRHLSVGYNRAARLVEDMENAGLVSAMNTRGQREILAPKHRQDEQ